MSENRIHLEFAVSGNNFASAGSASEEVKSTLKKLGIASADIRRVAIAMYEGEINMVIHAGAASPPRTSISTGLKSCSQTRAKGYRMWNWQ